MDEQKQSNIYFKFCCYIDTHLNLLEFSYWQHQELSHLRAKKIEIQN